MTMVKPQKKQITSILPGIKNRVDRYSLDEVSELIQRAYRYYISCGHDYNGSILLSKAVVNCASGEYAVWGDNTFFRIDSRLYVELTERHGELTMFSPTVMSLLPVLRAQQVLDDLAEA